MLALFAIEIWWGAAQKDDLLRYNDDDFFFRLRMCLAEGALIESGKTKTSNHFTFIEHNYLRPRFTLLSSATRTCFFISCKYMICTIFTYFELISYKPFYSMLEWLFNGTSVRLTVKSFNYFLYKMCLSYFVISALNVSACNL